MFIRYIGSLPEKLLWQSLRTCFLSTILVLIASTQVSAQQSLENRRLRGIKAVEVAAPVYIQGQILRGNETLPFPSCYVDSNKIQRTMVEVFRTRSAIDAYTRNETTAETNQTQRELAESLEQMQRRSQRSPQSPMPRSWFEANERRTQEIEARRARGYVRLRISSELEATGFCINSLILELLASPIDPVQIRATGEQLRAAIVLWDAPPLALRVAEGQVLQDVIEGHTTRLVMVLADAMLAANRE